MSVETEGKTLGELGVKPGDVVRYIPDGETGFIDECMKWRGNRRGRQLVSTSTARDWAIVSRAEAEAYLRGEPEGVKVVRGHYAGYTQNCQSLPQVDPATPTPDLAVGGWRDSEIWRESLPPDTRPVEPDCPDCGLPHPSTNPYCFCRPAEPGPLQGSLEQLAQATFANSIPVQAGAVDWEQRRWEAMLAALTGIMANPVRWKDIKDRYDARTMTYEQASASNARKAVSIADALITAAKEASE